MKITHSQMHLGELKGFAQNSMDLWLKYFIILYLYTNSEKVIFKFYLG